MTDRIYGTKPPRHGVVEGFPAYNSVTAKRSQRRWHGSPMRYITLFEYRSCSLIEDDGEDNDADKDKYGDVLSPRHSDHRGLRKFNEHEEFNDNENEKDLERVDVE
jgi:hypothetical protein